MSDATQNDSRSVDTELSLNDDLSFLKRERSPANKRTKESRQKDFDEIYVAQKNSDLSEQASRCLDCGNPYCEWKCPLHNYIPDWLKLVTNHQFDQAAELMHQSNPLPEICGRVCPQDRLCEQACTLNTGFGAVTIGAVEKHIADRALDQNWRPDLSKVMQTGKSVAIVGAGPAGLGCAELLARNGVKAVVYDRYPEIGGLLTFGIPGFKLEKSVIRKRKQFLEDIGVEFQLNTNVGADISIESIKKTHNALFLAMGTYRSLDGRLSGLESDGVIKALDYLVGNINQQQSYGMNESTFYDISGKKVIVLGGGDTAMDCVRSAIRQDASVVQCVYRRLESEMPGSNQEVNNAKEEGVEFTYQLQPLAIESKDGKVTGVRFHITSGDNEGEQILLEADKVIIAFGFSANPARWFESLGIDLQENGLVKTQFSATAENQYLQQTNIENVYAGGDMVRGADLVVTAIAEGRKAAQEILTKMGINI